MTFQTALEVEKFVCMLTILPFIAELRQPEREAEHHSYRNRTTCLHGNRNPCNSFFVVNMASGIDHELVLPTTTTTTTSHNMAAIQLSHPGLPLRQISLILDIRIMFNWRPSYHEIRWPVSRDHIAGSGLELIKFACFFKLAADQVYVFDWIVSSCQVNLLFGSRLTLTQV